MEYETSDDSSNSENGSFTSKSTIYEQEAISEKIAKLKKRISELEDISTAKEVMPKKANKRPLTPLTRNKVHDVEDEFSFDKTSKVTTNKYIIEDESSDNKTTIKKAKKGQIINDFSSNNAEKEPLKQLKQSRQQFSVDTEFSSDDPEQESMRLIVAERLYRLCSTTEYRDMPLTEINKCIDKIPETQDTTVSTNNRINPPKKGMHVEHNAVIDIDESDTNLSGKNITKKGKQVDHNAPADVDRSDLNDNSKHAKKGKQVDHNAPIDVDESDPNDAKKGKQADHNAPINVDESDPNLSEKDIALDEIPKTQDTSAPTNNRTGARKPKNRKHVDHNASIESDSNNNSKRATKGTRVNHNSPIDVNESDPNLSAKILVS
ncbi:6614_t:CDS:2, partial [Racocetra fulgida]